MDIYGSRSVKIMPIRPSATTLIEPGVQDPDSCVRIRIQHFGLNTDLDLFRIQDFHDQKLKKNVIFLYIFFD